MLANYQCRIGEGSSIAVEEGPAGTSSTVLPRLLGGRLHFQNLNFVASPELPERLVFGHLENVLREIVVNLNLYLSDVCHPDLYMHRSFHLSLLSGSPPNGLYYPQVGGVDTVPEMLPKAEAWTLLVKRTDSHLSGAYFVRRHRQAR